LASAKASAIAHPIQGLIKYHGLRDAKRRIPYHDSISVCAEALHTHATVEFDVNLGTDEVWINGQPGGEREVSRVLAVIDPLRRLARNRSHVKVATQNSLIGAKGLGFSSSAFAAIGRAAKEALQIRISDRELSEIVRLGSGSATRSLVGGFAIWYHNKGGRSFAERLSAYGPLRMVIVPQPSDVFTEEAHEEVIHSPFFRARLKYLKNIIPRMKRAVLRKDVKTIGELAETDTLNLHAVTMTSIHRLILFSEGSIRVMRIIRELREVDDLLAWFSLDTGPSVFVNTTAEYAPTISRRLVSEGFDTVESGVGGEARLVDVHLF